MEFTHSVEPEPWNGSGSNINWIMGGGFSDGLGFNLVGQISERLGVDTGGVKLTSSWFNMYTTLVFYRNKGCIPFNCCFSIYPS